MNTPLITVPLASVIKVTLPKGKYRAAFLGVKNIQFAITPKKDGGTEKCTLYPVKWDEVRPDNTGHACLLFDKKTGYPIGEVYSDCIGEA